MGGKKKKINNQPSLINVCSHGSEKKIKKKKVASEGTERDPRGPSKRSSLRFGERERKKKKVTQWTDSALMHVGESP